MVPLPALTTNTYSYLESPKIHLPTYLIPWLGSARLGSARLSSARLGSARLASACASVENYVCSRTDGIQRKPIKMTKTARTKAGKWFDLTASSLSNSSVETLRLTLRLATPTLQGLLAVGCTMFNLDLKAVMMLTTTETTIICNIKSDTTI